MFWVFHNGVTLDVLNSKETAMELAIEVSRRHPGNPAIVRFVRT